MGLSPRTLRPANNFTPRSIAGLALWLDASDGASLYTTDAGAVTAVSAPTEIGSLAIWLDASDSSTLFQDAAATTSASAASDPVGCWKDKSGNERHYTGSSTTRPLLAIAKHNGRNSIYFDGTDDFLGVSGGSTTNSNSTLADATGACAWVVYEPNSDIDYAVLKFANSASGYERFTNGATYHTYFRTSRFTALSPAPPTSGLTLLASSASVATDSQALRINGSTIVSQPCATTFAAWRALTSQAWTVGQDAAFLNGWVSEVIVLGRSATATEVAQVEKYLAAKWGISGVHTPATATSDPVGYWGDKSGNGRHAVQATGSLRPTLGTLGAKNALSFAGNAIATQSYAARATSTYVYVGRHDDGSDTFFQTGQTNGFHSHLVEGGVSKFRRYETGLKGVVLGTNVGVGVASLWCVDFSNDAISVRHNGVTYGTTLTASETPISDSSRATTLGRLAAAETYAQLNGRIAEFMVYGGRNLTVSERGRLERFLAAKYGITLAPQVANPDAQDWINRVYANGGTVSSSTAAAVSTFCDAIDAAAIRDRFYRLNLFAGGTSGTTAGLAACLVPLYRGPSLGGTQYGNTTDTNVGPFVVGDYAETGLSAGSGKHLRTGVTQANVGTACHLAFYDCVRATNAYANRIGSRGATDTHEHALTNVDVATTIDYGSSAIAGNQRSRATGYTQAGAFWMGVNPSATSSILYKNGASAATATPVARTAQNLDYWVFALNNNGSLDSVQTTGRSGGYSIGLSMNATQAAAYYTAMQAFQTALGRNV